MQLINRKFETFQFWFFSRAYFNDKIWLTIRYVETTAQLAGDVQSSLGDQFLIS